MDSLIFVFNIKLLILVLTGLPHHHRINRLNGNTVSHSAIPIPSLATACSSYIQFALLTCSLSPLFRRLLCPHTSTYFVNIACLTVFIASYTFDLWLYSASVCLFSLKTCSYRKAIRRYPS